MKEEPVDPRMEKLVASLYGELPADEERELQEQLRKDPALKAEWDEMVSMRSMLGEVTVEEAVPSFVMMDTAAPQARRVVAVGGFWGDLKDKLGGFFAVSGWAVAAAAILVMVLAIKGYRIEKRPDGYALVTNPHAALSNGPENVAQNVSAPVTNPGNGTAPPPVQQVTTPNGPVQLVSGDRPVTRKELDDKSLEMMRLFSQMMNEDRSRQDAQTVNLMQTVVGRLSDSQTDLYRDLRGRIDAVGLGLMGEQSKTNERMDIMEQAVVDSLNKKSENGNGGDKK